VDARAARETAETIAKKTIRICILKSASVGANAHSVSWGGIRSRDFVTFAAKALILVGK
jgi:hypothetical protein